MLEVQQNSDTTYRLYDWDRLGLDGAPRTLQVADGLAAIHWGETACHRSGGTHEIGTHSECIVLAECRSSGWSAWRYRRR